MKQIATIAIILLLSIGGRAEEVKNEVTQKVLNLENRVNTLENQQKLFDAAIALNQKNAQTDFESKFNDIKKENRTIEVISGILVLLGIIAFATIIYQIFWGFKKTIDKKILVLQNEFSIEFEKRAEVAKKAFNEAIRLSEIEINLKKHYRLNILFKGAQKENLEQFCGMLHSFNFNCVPCDKIEASSLNEYDIILFFDDTNEALMTQNEKGESVSTKKSKWLVEQLSKKDIVGLKDTCGFFFINKTGLLHNFKEMNIDCFSSATTFATMYENLMSLLHYKRYLNNR